MTILDEYVATARQAPAAPVTSLPPGPSLRALIRAHAAGGRLNVGGDLTRPMVRALARRGMVEPVYEQGRADRRKVILGMQLTVLGSREAIRLMRGL